MVEATLGDVLRLDVGALICEKCTGTIEIKQSGVFIKGDFDNINSVEDLFNAIKRREIVGTSEGFALKKDEEGIKNGMD